MQRTVRLQTGKYVHAGYQSTEPMRAAVLPRILAVTSSSRASDIGYPISALRNFLIPV
jgi:hypothetical protein